MTDYKFPQTSLLKLFITLLLLILLTIIIVITVYINNMDEKESFTEFYILGTEGKANDYPLEINLGGEAKVIAGIINHEQITMTYKIETYINDILSSTIERITIKNTEKWENIISIKPVFIGDKQLVEFILDDAVKTSHSDFNQLTLRLWLNVK